MLRQSCTGSQLFLFRLGQVFELIFQAGGCGTVKGSPDSFHANRLTGCSIFCSAGTAAGIGVIGDDPEALQSAVKKAAVLCTGKKSGTSTLIFKRDGKYQAIAFKPSDKLVKMIEEIIAAVSAA